MGDAAVLAMLQSRQRRGNILCKLNHHRHQGVYPHLKWHYLSYGNFINSSKMKNRKCAKKGSYCRNDDVALGKGAEILSKNSGPCEWHAGTRWDGEVAVPTVTVSGKDRQVNPPLKSSERQKQ